MAWIARIRRAVLSLILLTILITHVFVLVCTRPSPDGISALGGYKVFQVMGHSMDPALHQGDVIFVRPLPPEAVIQKGDIITFQTPDSAVLVTHRVVDVVSSGSGEDGFLTKGDANPAPDATPVWREQVIGRYAFRIPLLGWLSLWILRPAGFAVTALLSVLLLTEAGIRLPVRTGG